jgi:tRNA-binding EMAP/Myf-like protein
VIWINEQSNSYVLQASTGLVMKIKQADMMVLTTLSVLQNPQQQSKPVMLCSFGNIDLLKTFKHVLTELKSEGLTRHRVKTQLKDDF